MSRLLGVFIATLVIYIVLGTLIAVISRRRLRGGIRDYYVSEGRLGSFLAAMTYAATTYSSFMIVGLVGFTYTTGVGALGFEMAYYVATLGLLLIIGERVWRASRERGWVSPAQMVADLTGSRWIAPLISIIFIVSLVFYASAQLKAIGEAVAAAGGQSYYMWGVLLGLIVMLVWSSIAGIWSVAATDAFQGLWMIIAGFGLLAWLLHAAGSSGLSISEAGKILVESGHLTPSGHGGYWKPSTFTAFALPWIFFAVTNPQALQRLYMPRDRKALRDMIRWFAVFGLIYTALVTFIGLLAYALNEAGALNVGIPASVKYADRVTPSLLVLSGPVLGAVVFTSIIAAAVSTADSILLTLASSASMDLLPGSASERSRKIAGLTTIVVIGVVMAAIALARVSFIVKLSVLSSLMLLSLAPPILALIAGARVSAPFAGLAVIMGPLLVAVELAVKLPSSKSAVAAVIATFGSTPLGVPLAVWILLLSSLLTVAGLRRP